MEFGVVFESIDPAVAHAVRELLLLSPEDLVWQIWLGIRLIRSVECFSQDPFLDTLLRDHLLLWIDVHADF
ncbi:hypothetical protein RRF57_007841 [Xylaria bambusicola]|uniref:Uncharacterized protein n=1 Tax=Xylaria bambusicola TaxID=326684 RepID=A0AAN7UNE0_9PEZI